MMQNFGDRQPRDEKYVWPLEVHILYETVGGPRTYVVELFKNLAHMQEKR